MFFFRMNKIYNKIFCEVALRTKLLDGSFDDKITKICSSGDVPEKCIISFDRQGGNGCILKKFITPIFIQEYSLFAIAIAVTAAHVVCDPISGLCNYDKITGHIKGIPTSFDCIKLKDLLRILTSSSPCSNGSPYLLNEGDLALLLVLSPSDTVELNEIDIEQLPVNLNTKCYLSGIPYGINIDCNYNYPYTEDEDEAKKRMTQIFHSPSELIVSEGHLISIHQFLEINCSACTGLSGSPIISNNKLIGIFCGGPPLPGQKELFNSLKCLDEEKYFESWRFYQEFESFSFHYENFSRMSILFGFKSIFMRMNVRIPDELYSVHVANSMDLKEEQSMLMRGIYRLIQDLVKKFRNKDNYCLNIALPTWGEGFRMIFEFAENVIIFTKGKREISVREIITY
jgi:hypothetical protein